MVSTQTQTDAGQWTIDGAHATAEFRVRHLMISTVRGRFSGIAGTIAYDEANPAASRVEVEIPAAAIDTGNADRDNHLRSPDFLNAPEFPTLRFASTRVEPKGSDRATVHGVLSIRGVARPVAIEAELSGRGVNPWGKEVVAFSGTTRIDRREWGLTWNVGLEAGGVLVSDQVEIHLDLEANPAA